MAGSSYPRIASFRSARAIAGYLGGLGWQLPIDDEILTAPSSPLAQSLDLPWQGGRRRIGNRFAVQPMEGWDGETDGAPSELTRRRWLRFARSGAKLIWGCEAVAVLPEARANPNQLLLNEHTQASFEALRQELVKAHAERFGQSADLVVGLQLTHSGRFSKPHEKTRREPVIVYHHPILDAQFHLPREQEPISDAGIARIVRAFGDTARRAREAGFDFVDLKHCHGYLGHEFLSARCRPGPYGGSFLNRTRFLGELIAAVRNSAPGLEIGVRFSAYDTNPLVQDEDSGPAAEARQPDAWSFGWMASDACSPDLREARCLLQLLRSLDVRLVNVSAGSPYYSPHIQRPALFPPCDGYPPPEDPLAGAARLQVAARDLKAAAEDFIFVSSGWSYFQNFLPHYAQAAVREGWTDLVGLGRMMLSYPELPADVLEKGRLDPKRICRTFSDCTNGPRNSLISGCYPLDPFYKARPEAEELKSVKLQQRGPVPPPATTTGPGPAKDDRS